MWSLEDNDTNCYLGRNSGGESASLQNCNSKAPVKIQRKNRNWDDYYHDMMDCCLCGGITNAILVKCRVFKTGGCSTSRAPVM